MKGNNQAYKLWLCLLCSFILLPLEIQAQEKGDSITGKVHKIDEVTVTAERTKQQVKSSSPFQQLNKKQLQLMIVVICMFQASMQKNWMMVQLALILCLILCRHTV